MRRTHPLSDVAVTSASLSHGLHFANHRLLVFPWHLYPVDHVVTESALAARELTLSLLELLDLTNPSSNPLSLESCKRRQDRENDSADSVTRDITTKVNEVD